MRHAAMLDWRLKHLVVALGVLALVSAGPAGQWLHPDLGITAALADDDDDDDDGINNDDDGDDVNQDPAPPPPPSVVDQIDDKPENNLDKAYRIEVIESAEATFLYPAWLREKD